MTVAVQFFFGCTFDLEPAVWAFYMAASQVAMGYLRDCGVVFISHKHGMNHVHVVQGESGNGADI